MTARLRRVSIPPSPKCVTLQRLEAIVRAKRRQKQSMAFTNGCFDILHVGHIGYLEAARQLGDYLVVAVNSDASVRRLKGPSRPIHDQRSRARVLAGLAAVDCVVIFSSKRVTPLLKRLKPEHYIKGGDYRLQTLDPGERQAVESSGGRIHLLRLWPGHSTTSTLRKIQA